MRQLAGISFLAAFYVVASTPSVYISGNARPKPCCSSCIKWSSELLDTCIISAKLPTVCLIFQPRFSARCHSLLPGSPGRTKSLYAADSGRWTRARAAELRKARPRASLTLTCAGCIWDDPASQTRALRCSPRQQTTRISGLVWHPSPALAMQSHGNVGLHCQPLERGRYRTRFGIRCLLTFGTPSVRAFFRLAARYSWPRPGRNRAP